jgi:hypothetical protein
VERLDRDRAAPVFAMVVDIFEKAIVLFRQRGRLEIALFENFAVKVGVIRRGLPIV